MGVRGSARWAALLAVLVLAGCSSTNNTGPSTSAAGPTAATTASASDRPTALFYSKAGSLYVSAPAGTPGRKLTDGPADAWPAPAPDLSRVAFVRKSGRFGGALWVLDLAPDLTPEGPARELVDPAELPRHKGYTGVAPISHPRWSPTGRQVAFIANPTNGGIDGGLLFVVAADTGTPASGQRPPFAETNFAWSPDGSHIAWLNERSDVRPTDVNALATGGSSTPVATGTNASSATFARDGRTILFTNGEAPSSNTGGAPFTLREGGIYVVEADSGPTPPTPMPLFTKPGSYYNDLALLDSGAMAFTAQTETRGGEAPRTIQVLDAGSARPRTVVTDVTTAPVCSLSPTGEGSCDPPPRPVWGPGDLVAYVDTAPERFLVVTDADNRDPRRVDAGVDSYAWVPAS